MNKEVTFEPSSNSTKISSTRLRAETRDILERARFNGERFIIYTHGKPMAVLMSFSEFETITDEETRSRR